MFNKISSFNIQSDKNNSWNQVFVAQPDSLKENLAGKIFILAEFSGKKHDGEKIFNFLVSSLEENYYNDEKLLLKEKIEGLKTENIFEAALAKTNIAFSSFLEEEKISLNHNSTNLTIGVVFENNIYFSNFGKNRALLLYQQKNNYEVINVETNAFEKENTKKSEVEVASPKIPKIFASVISGEIPKNAFFLFSSESLPEYISEKELSSIVSKLPPLTAAFQIKGLLEKINTHVAFFGVIIKSASELEAKDLQEELREPITAHSSISSLKNTEKKTEAMLSTGGLVNFTKVSTKLRELMTGLKSPNKENLKIINRLNKQDQEDAEIKTLDEVGVISEAETKINEVEKKLPNQNPTPSLSPTKTKANPDFGIIRTLGAVKKDSNVLKEQFSFKKNNSKIFSRFKLGGSILNIFDVFKLKNSKLSSKNRALIIALPLIAIILIFSINSIKQKNNRLALEEKFSEIAAEINRQESMIEAKMLYDDREGASALLLEINNLIAELPKNLKNKQELYEEINKKSFELQERIYKINRISTTEKLYDFGEFNIKKLAFLGDSLYAASNDGIFKLDGSENPKKIEAEKGIDYYNIKAYNDDSLAFFNNKKVTVLNTKTEKINNTNISGYETENGLVSFALYSTNLYLLDRENNEIKVHRKTGTNYGPSSNWFKEEVDLAKSQDLYIDGSIYVLNNDASVLKYYTGKKQDYSAQALEPLSSNFKKIIGTETKLYLLNPSEKRVAVLDKNSGNLLNQYIFEDLENIDDFAVDEVNKIFYFLSNNTLSKFLIQ
ncbi:hypothetical protein JXK06_03510 [Patescibacteria group bacterium]|nr:hypothetical protein [Patescibacteria group bacterium]